MKIGDICSNIRDKEDLGTLRTLPGKGLNLGLIEHKSAIREEFWRPLYLPIISYSCDSVINVDSSVSVIERSAGYVVLFSTPVFKVCDVYSQITVVMCTPTVETKTDG